MIEWNQTIAICGTMIGAVGFLALIIRWLVFRIDKDVDAACDRIDKMGEKIDKQGERIDKLIYAFMNFQRDTDKLIHECQTDIAKIKKIIPEFSREERKK